HHDRDLETEALLDQPLALARHPVGCGPAPEHDVAALEIGLHLAEACVRQRFAQLRHRDPVAGAEVDPAQEDDVLRHGESLRQRWRGWHAAPMSRELAIRLRGVVKRYGPIAAVDGLDLDVPVGTCVGLLGPNGAGKSTTMRLLTAQSIADEGELEVLGFRLPGESKQARAQRSEERRVGKAWSAPRATR